MAITNRALDVSQQKEDLQTRLGAVATGASVMVCLIPYNSTLKYMAVAAAGLSGSPVLLPTVERFIVGSGDTLITGAASSLALTAFGTSGLQSISLAASGSSLLQLLAGDLVHVSISGANSNALEINVALVIQAVQDVKAMFGSAV